MDVKRREEGYVGKIIIEIAIPGKRKRGRPKRKWVSLVKEDMEMEQGRETKLTESYGEDLRAMENPYWK